VYAAKTVTSLWRTWDSLRNAIGEVFNYQMFGIVNSGADVCGTLGALDEELCARWIQATSLFPI